MRLFTLLGLCSLFHPVNGQLETTIEAIQMVDTGGGSDASPLNGQLVQFTGIVTASAEPNNLDAVFVQQEGLVEWAGIRLVSGGGLNTLKLGDLVEVTGNVSENSGMTVISFVSEFEVLDTSRQITPVKLDPGLFTSYNLATNEKYEGMLVELAGPKEPVTVVQSNADGPNNNFGEWRVGSDPEVPGKGCRVLTGRQTSSVFSSLNVSWVNDEAWASNSGTMNVDPIVVMNGDAFESLKGIMVYGQGDFKILPRNNDDVVPLTSGIRFFDPEEIELTLFPNPARAAPRLKFTLEAPSSIAVAIVDMLGNTVLRIDHRAYPEGSHAIDLRSDFSPGSYFVKFFVDEGMVTLPFIYVQ